MASFPEDSIQDLTEQWWIKTPGRQLEYGRLVKAFLPHTDQQPYVLVAKGRTHPEQHDRADFEVEPLRENAPPRGAYLPVAGLPEYPGEVRIVQRAKKRPAVVLSTSGSEVEKGLRTGARYITNRTVLVAPYYGAEQSRKRGGWNETFVTRIRRARYPQYVWAQLPITGAKSSILRLDHIQPLGTNAQALELTPYKLSEDARLVLEEWIQWFRRGTLDENGGLAYFKGEMSAL